MPGGVYHVFTRAVHRNILFDDDAHYRYFVELLRDRVAAFAELFAYALIPNHLHSAIQLFSDSALAATIEARPRSKRTAKEKQWLAGKLSYNMLIGDYFATLMAMYANYVNPKLGRKGTLFDQTIRRVRVREDLVSRRLIMYIHTNEVKHRMRSTYSASGVKTSFVYYGIERADHWLARRVVLERFGGLETFYAAHERYVLKYGAQISDFDEALYFDPGGLVDEAPWVEFLEGE